MPGYVIHLAVAKEYMKRNKIEDVKKFEDGVISPDITDNKKISHYGTGPAHPDLNRYIQENSNFNSYTEGYFLHLLTDYLFYNQFLKVWDKNIYKDYNILNGKLIEKYGITIPKKIKDVVEFSEGELHILNEGKLCEFIDSVGKIDIRNIISQKVSLQSQIEDEIK